VSGWRLAPTALALVFVAAIFALLFFPHGDLTMDESSYSVVRSGYRLTYELLESLDHDVHRFPHGIEELPEGATVWLLEPGASLMDEGPAGMGTLAEWVSRGNTLVLGLGGHRRSLGDRLMDRIEERERGDGELGEDVPRPLKPHEEQEILSPAGDPSEALSALGIHGVRVLGGRTPLGVGFDDPMPVTTPLSDVNFLRGVRQAPTFDGDGLAAGEVLVESVDGPLVWRVAVGDGQVLLLSDSRLVSNWALAGADNAYLLEWLAQLSAGDGPILFEEFSHGYTTATSLPRLLLRPPLLFVTLQVLLVLATLVAWRAVRFGPPRPAPRGDRRYKAEHVEAVADLHRRGLHSTGAAGRLRMSLLTRLRERLGYGTGLGEEQLFQVVARRTGQDPQEIQRDAALPTRPGPREMTRYARRLERLHRRIEE
jgi:Domain of unknown function (DUF4350)